MSSYDPMVLVIQNVSHAFALDMASSCFNFMASRRFSFVAMALAADFAAVAMHCAPRERDVWHDRSLS